MNAAAPPIPLPASAANDHPALDPDTWRRICRFTSALASPPVRIRTFETPRGDPVVVVVAEERREVSRRELRKRFGLTPREAEVALLLDRRLSSKEIAVQLGVTIHTARRHTERVLAKMGLASRRDVRHVIAELGAEGGRTRRPDA